METVVQQYNLLLDEMCAECLYVYNQHLDFFQYMEEKKLSSKYAHLVFNQISTTNDWKAFSYYLEQYVNTNSQYWPVSSYIKALYDGIYNFVFVIFPDAPLLNLEFTRAVGSGAETNFVLPVFDEQNIVTEDMFEVHFEDDVYVQGEPVDTEGIIKEFKAVEDMTTLLGAAAPEAMNSEEITISEVDSETEEGRTSKNTIEAAIGIIASVNDFGHMLMRGSTCPVCGKRVDFMPSNGYCSLKCAGLDLLKKVQETLTGEYQSVSEETEKKINMVKNILNYTNLTLNVIAKLPDILASIARLPQEYKDYATAKINIVFVELKKIINLLMIKKNDIIISLLRKIKLGCIDDKLKPIFEVINKIIDIANALKAKMELAIEAAMKAIIKASALFYIGPQEYGFFMTLKSNQAFCPFFKTDPTVYPPGQLGRPFWGSGVINIAFDMSKCQFSLDIGAKSALSNVDFKKINKIVRAVFRPISEVEYLMDPDLFDVRLALSDQNAPMIQSLLEKLSTLIVLGGDFIPSYKNLKLTNIWFIIAILTCWGPWTRAIFGDFIFHGML